MSSGWVKSAGRVAEQLVAARAAETTEGRVHADEPAVVVKQRDRHRAGVEDRLELPDTPPALRRETDVLDRKSAVTVNASSARRVAAPGRIPSRGRSTDSIPSSCAVGGLAAARTTRPRDAMRRGRRRPGGRGSTRRRRPALDRRGRVVEEPQLPPRLARSEQLSQPSRPWRRLSKASRTSGGPVTAATSMSSSSTTRLTTATSKPSDSTIVSATSCSVCSDRVQPVG